MKRVVVTGQGAISALGHSAVETGAALREGRSGIGTLDVRDFERLSVRIGAQVRDYAPAERFDRHQLALYDRFTQFTLIAAQEAVAQSGLALDAELALEAGVVLGTAAGGVATWDESYRAVYEQGKNRVHPLVVPKLMHNAAASHVAMTFDLRGPSFSVATACASSNHAMGQAFQLVRSGASRVMLTGGADAMLCFGGMKAWEGLRVMSQQACRPFSADRDGMVQGEGAAVFVFEEYEHARARGAEILAEVAGFGMTSDAADIVVPSQAGAARAMSRAMADGRITPAAVGYINAHGTGTTVNDRTECAAVAEVFGAHADRLMISSTKSMHGHVIGGTGAVELVACLMALRQGIVAPTAGHRKPDPDCRLDVVPNTAREAHLDVVLSNAFAFGGLNAVLALRRV